MQCIIVIHYIAFKSISCWCILEGPYSAWRCDAVKTPDNVDVAAVAVGGGTGAASIDSEVEVGHLSSYIGVTSISISPYSQWQ